MMDALKTGSAVHIYVGGVENGRLVSVLADLGYEARPLGPPDAVQAPAVLILSAGEPAPEGMEDIAIRPPADATPAALREILALSVDNALLRQDVKRLQDQERKLHRQFEELNQIGIKLTAERDIPKLHDYILLKMRQLTNADGASLWLKEIGDDGVPMLFFASSQNHSIGDTYRAFKVPVDEKSIVGYCVMKGESLIYDDAYNPPPGKPQGGKGFDAQYGYRTKSVLAVPMRDYNEDIVGAIQLINAKRKFDTKLAVENVEAEVVSFRPEDLEMLESIASQAAVNLDAKTLLDQLQQTFDGVVQASVTAIEERDKITSGHSRRVETLTSGLAHAVHEIATGRYRDTHFTEDQFRELQYACWLHDFGKVSVSEEILQKEKKLPPRQLPTIWNRFEFLQRSAQFKYANQKFEIARLEGFESPRLAELDRMLERELAELRTWYEEIALANEPSVLPENKASMLAGLSQRTYEDMSGVVHPVLGEDEFRFLSIPKGTLDSDERSRMEYHVTSSYYFLRTIPWTSVMKRIPEIAYGHHEKLDGSGYPRHLTGDQIPPEARMMTISDIYDALTAANRPYKPAVRYERALDILHAEAKAGKLDSDLLDVFTHKRIYELTPHS